MENRFLTCHEDSVIQTQKSGFKAATIRVKSAHWGGDWFFFGGVIERFQNLRQVCSRNSLLVQFLCCFTKQSPRIYHENQNKEAKKKNKKTKHYYGRRCSELWNAFHCRHPKTTTTLWPPGKCKESAVSPFHSGQSQGHLEDAAEVLSLLVDMKWQTMCDAQQPHHLVPRNTSGDGESQFERTRGSAVIYTEETGATFKFQSEGAEWVTAQQWWMLLQALACTRCN